MSYSRSTAVHEAGHAVQAWALGVSVGALWVGTDGAGGGTKIGPNTHLTLLEQVAIWLSGAVAQEVFNCPGHDLSSFRDNVGVMELLEDHGVSEETEGPALRARASDLAAKTLTTHQAKVMAIADHLEQNGRLEASGFESLMRTP
ncbi:hypothetical protein BSZ19_10590 [Bradyrhizobium japonicum]|uniref:Peptidase M41 domain-containing protein n=1 Tax=Bradyrhizobium japonicum TaxID=375 RepID=A0A1Y2JT61_BRAJP|nr:hypothetical protein [Bradyrhizobium japonicum]OSJ34849.1 hypothetical protein BSZ19_10590 [Bradyrhizobium japonicum]